MVSLHYGMHIMWHRITFIVYKIDIRPLYLGAKYEGKFTGEPPHLHISDQALCLHKHANYDDSIYS